ncbi:hypothetical protein [Cupriavidus necator]|uniref:hypothetical protein n=1 Tax=Cupriavidus necator TaxID=106590 RepID=UPI00339D953F
MDDSETGLDQQHDGRVIQYRIPEKFGVHAVCGGLCFQLLLLTRSKCWRKMKRNAIGRDFAISNRQPEFLEVVLNGGLQFIRQQPSKWHRLLQKEAQRVVPGQKPLDHPAGGGQDLNGQPPIGTDPGSALDGPRHRTPGAESLL